VEAAQHRGAAGLKREEHKRRAAAAAGTATIAKVQRVLAAAACGAVEGQGGVGGSATSLYKLVQQQAAQPLLQGAYPSGAALAAAEHMSLPLAGSLHRPVIVSTVPVGRS